MKVRTNAEWIVCLKTSHKLHVSFVRCVCECKCVSVCVCSVQCVVLSVCQSKLATWELLMLPRPSSGCPSGLQLPTFWDISWARAVTHDWLAGIPPPTGLWHTHTYDQRHSFFNCSGFTSCKVKLSIVALTDCWPSQSSQVEAERCWVPAPRPERGKVAPRAETVMAFDSVWDIQHGRRQLSGRLTGKWRGKEQSRNRGHVESGGAVGWSRARQKRLCRRKKRRGGLLSNWCPAAGKWDGWSAFWDLETLWSVQVQVLNYRSVWKV